MRKKRLRIYFYRNIFQPRQRNVETLGVKKKETETEKELMLMTGVCITGQMSYGSSSEGEMCINDMVNATDLVINQWTGE